MLGLCGCEGDDGDGGSFALIDLLPSQIAEWTRQDPADTYHRESIFEYINDAGEDIHLDVHDPRADGCSKCEPRGSVFWSCITDEQAHRAPDEVRN